MKTLVMAALIAAGPAQEQPNVNQMVVAVLKEVVESEADNVRPVILDVEASDSAFSAGLNVTQTIRLDSGGVSLPIRAVRAGAWAEAVTCSDHDPWTDCSIPDDGMAVSFQKTSRGPGAGEITAYVRVGWIDESGMLIGYTMEMILGRVANEWKVVRRGIAIVR